MTPEAFEIRNVIAPLELQCFVCKNYSRAYLSHLFRAGELTSHRLLSVHNIRFLTKMMEQVRECIKDGTFLQFKAEMEKAYK